jgi:polysaccharide export outer membrane protein
MAGSTCTNYQIFPGDRIYVAAQPVITLNNTLAKIVAPIEQLFGVTLLGAATVNTIRTNPNNNNNNGTTGVIVPSF